MTPQLPLAMTMGEPAGIGSELTLKAWLARRPGVGPFFAVDDPRQLASTAERLSLPVPIKAIVGPHDANEAFDSALPVLPVSLRRPVRPGHPDPENAPATIEAIERAVEFALKGDAAGVVTNPIQKKTLQEAGFSHPGHTEFLAELASRHAGMPVDVVMMLACPQLRVVPVTIHIPLMQVARALSTDAIIRAGRITASGLRTLFGINSPRVVVAGLNPHAGEQGAMGNEESRIIAPAIEVLRNEGIEIRGPASADTLFHPAARATYDVALCMYHDQALIPIKTIDFSGGVNVTLGLPFVRTSPDHGTALDIAGSGRADVSSLMAALAMAGDMAGRRGS